MNQISYCSQNCTSTQKLQFWAKVNHLSLFVFPFCCNWDSVVTFVLNHYTKQANALANAATMHFQHLVMFGAAFLLQGCRHFHQRVPFESCRLILGLQLSGSVWAQSQLDSLQLLQSAKITSTGLTPSSSEQDCHTAEVLPEKSASTVFFFKTIWLWGSVHTGDSWKKVHRPPCPSSHLHTSAVATLKSCRVI